MTEKSIALSVVGFDSAWTDNPKRPGAICIIRAGGSDIQFVEPVMASFDAARQVIEREREISPYCLIAIDQPTLVPNVTGMRPVDRLAGSYVSWLGGGVQPANRSKKAMFGDDAPIWRFKKAIAAVEDPELCRGAEIGCFMIEVFPALALAGIEEVFCGRLCAPRYNPARRKTFQLDAWQLVLSAVSKFAKYLNVDAGEWCDRKRQVEKPKKADQDELDAVICALVGLHWVRSPRHQSMMLGNLSSGYMIAPVLAGVHDRVRTSAKLMQLPVDGRVPA